MNSATAKKSDEVSAILSALTARLLEHDHTTDVLLNAWRCEQEVTVSFAIGFGVFDVDGLESLANRAGTFICC